MALCDVRQLWSASERQLRKCRAGIGMCGAMESLLTPPFPIMHRGLKSEALCAQISVRARTQFSEPEPEFASSTLARRPAKITTKRKSHLEPPAIEIVEVSPTSTAIQPPRWPTPAPRSRCARASSSATLCSAASRWSCESSSPLPPCPLRLPPSPTTRATNLRPCRGHFDAPGSRKRGFFRSSCSELGWPDLCRWTWWLTDHALAYSDILHPNRANISKEELRDKLAGLYKAQKDQVSVFGLRTQFGGGKTTGFALVYDSPEAMKKFEPHYRLVRVGLATKIEKASRQQRTFLPTMQAVSDSAAERGWDGREWQWLTLSPLPQASSARTGRRPCGVRRRSRAPSPRRRNRRLAFLLASSVFPGILAGGTMAVALCITLDCLLHPANLTPETLQLDFMMEA